MMDKTRDQFESWYLGHVGITLAEARLRGVADLSTLEAAWTASRSAAMAEAVEIVTAEAEAWRTKKPVPLFGYASVLDDCASAIRAKAGG